MIIKYLTSSLRNLTTLGDFDKKYQPVWPWSPGWCHCRVTILHVNEPWPHVTSVKLLVFKCVCIYIYTGMYIYIYILFICLYIYTSYPATYSFIFKYLPWFKKVCSVALVLASNLHASPDSNRQFPRCTIAASQGIWPCPWFVHNSGLLAGATDPFWTAPIIEVEMKNTCRDWKNIRTWCWLI